VVVYINGSKRIWKSEKTIHCYKGTLYLTRSYNLSSSFLQKALDEYGKKCIIIVNVPKNQIDRAKYFPKTLKIFL